MDHFIDVLHNDVTVVRELPSELSWSTREYYATGIRATRIKTAPLHASAEWYLENVLPVLQRLEYVFNTCIFWISSSWLDSLFMYSFFLVLIVLI